MTRATLTLAAALLLALPGFARADVIHLSNGRTLEGKIVSTTPTHIRLRVSGGQFELPRQRVQRVEKRRPASEDYAERARNTDMENPRQVKELADWASARNLGAQARQLRDLARLEQRIARAKAGRKASAYYDTYAWAKVQGFSPQIQRYLLSELLARWPEHRAAKRALEAVDAALRPKPTPAEREQAAIREKVERQAAEAEALKKRIQELEEAKRQAEEEAAHQRQVQSRRRRLRARRSRLARQRNGKRNLQPLFTLNRRERCE